MTLSRRSVLCLTAGMAGLPAVSSPTSAQAYPTRPITIIVPFPPGGGGDNLTRILAERMKVSLGQPVIIENVSGASGSIGVGRVARASPDGYVIGFGYWGTHVSNPTVYSLEYDVVNDFEPISLLVRNPWLIVVRNSLPARDLKEWIAWLKANPGKGLAATVGVGSAQHVLAVLFQNLTGTRLQPVTYRGGAPALQDVIAGHVDMLIETPGTCLPHVRSGIVKAFAVTDKTRFPAAPDIPTVDEAGVPGLYYISWSGFWAPKRTPKDVIGRFAAATVDALADPVVRSRLAEYGYEAFPREQQTPEALAAWQRAKIEKWWPILKAANGKQE
jgi:tripartite-type tricarboxylate transporter receptor subunit TctC